MFPGGWIWILRFNNGITSAGAAVTTTLARQLRLDDGEAGWQRLLDRLPGVELDPARPAVIGGAVFHKPPELWVRW